MKIIKFKDQKDLEEKFSAQVNYALDDKGPPKRIELAAGSSFSQIYSSFAKKIKDPDSILHSLRDVYFSSVDEIFEEKKSIEPRKIGHFAEMLIDQLLMPAGIPKKQWIMPGYFSKDELFSIQNIFMNSLNNLKQYGPLDWIFLGVGPNGHVAFNEPGSFIDNDMYKTVRLFRNSSLRLGHSREENIEPRLAITLSLNGILKSKKIFLIVNKDFRKRKIMKLFEENSRPTNLYPVSLIKDHPDLNLFIEDL